MGFDDSSGYECVDMIQTGPAGPFTVKRSWQSQCGWKEGVGYGLPNLFKIAENLSFVEVVLLLGAGVHVPEEYEGFYRNPFFESVCSNSTVLSRLHAALKDMGKQFPVFRAVEPDK
jgi:hypothetical protein